MGGCMYRWGKELYREVEVKDISRIATAIKGETMLKMERLHTTEIKQKKIIFS
jgi:hypothetical protein